PASRGFEADVLEACVIGDPRRTLGKRRVVGEPRGRQEMVRGLVEPLRLERDLAAQRVGVHLDAAALRLDGRSGAARDAGDQREVPGMLHKSVHVHRNGPPGRTSALYRSCGTSRLRPLSFVATLPDNQPAIFPGRGRVEKGGRRTRPVAVPGCREAADDAADWRRAPADDRTVNESIRRKLMALAERYEELAHLLSEPETIADKDRFRELSREYARLEPVAREFAAYQKLEEELAAAEELARGDDRELRALGEEEAAALRAKRAAQERQLALHLVPKDPDDDANLFLEIRAGTGGDEAALFAGDLFRMYSRYAEDKGWTVEVLSANEGEHGGYKEIISRIVGKGAYARLKFESGVHRVQRVPATEAQGRIHTSACTVAVMPEPE